MAISVLDTVLIFFFFFNTLGFKIRRLFQIMCISTRVTQLDSLQVRVQLERKCLELVRCQYATDSRVSVTSALLCRAQPAPQKFGILRFNDFFLSFPVLRR